MDNLNTHFTFNHLTNDLYDFLLFWICAENVYKQWNTQNHKLFALMPETAQKCSKQYLFWRKIYSKTVINNNDHFTPRKGSFTLCRKSVAIPGGDLDLLHSLKRTLLNYSQVNYSTWIRFTGNLRERDDCDSTKIFGGNVAKNFCSFLNRDLAPNRDLIRERLTSTSFCWSSRSRHQIMFCSSVVVAGDDDGVAVTVIVAHAAAVVVANCEVAIVTDNLFYFSF